MSKYIYQEGIPTPLMVNLVADYIEQLNLALSGPKSSILLGFWFIVYFLALFLSTYQISQDALPNSCCSCCVDVGYPESCPRPLLTRNSSGAVADSHDYCACQQWSNGPVDHAATAKVAAKPCYGYVWGKCYDMNVAQSNIIG